MKVKNNMSHNEFQQWEDYIKGMNKEINKKIIELGKEKARLNKILSDKLTQIVKCSVCSIVTTCDVRKVCYYCKLKEYT